MTARKPSRGNVRPNPRGKGFIADLSDGSRTDGSRVRHTKYVKTEAEGWAWLDELLAARTRGELARGRNQSLREFAQWWFTYEGPLAVKPTTLGSYQTIYHRYLDRWLGRKRLGDIEARHVVELMAQLGEDGYSRSTVRRTRALLHLLMNHAVLQEQIARNPVSLTKVPKHIGGGRRVHQDPLSLDEARTLLRVVGGTTLEGPVTIALCLGLRRGEVLALTWGAINLDERKLEVRQTLSERRVVGADGRGKTVLEIGTPKTRNALREINLTDAVFAVLQRRNLEARTQALAAGRKLDAHEPVFPGPDGTWRYPSNVLSQFKRLLARHDLRPIRFHDLRHTTATLMLEADVPLEQISQTLGHGSIQITKDTYAQYVPVLIPRAVNRLDVYLTGADEGEVDDRRVVALSPRPTGRPGHPRYRGSDR